MCFTHLLSRLISGKALSPSYYDDESVVASVDKTWKFLFNRACLNRVKINFVVFFKVLTFRQF